MRLDAAAAVAGAAGAADGVLPGVSAGVVMRLAAAALGAVVVVSACSQQQRTREQARKPHAPLQSKHEHTLQEAQHRRAERKSERAALGGPVVVRLSPLDIVDLAE